MFELPSMEALVSLIDWNAWYGYGVYSLTKISVILDSEGRDHAITLSVHSAIVT